MPGKQKNFCCPASCLVVNEVSVAIKTSSKVEREQRKSYNTRQLLSLFPFLYWVTINDLSREEQKQGGSHQHQEHKLNSFRQRHDAPHFLLPAHNYTSRQNLILVKTLLICKMQETFWSLNFHLFSILEWIFKKVKNTILPQCVERILAAP